ncbi:MAG: hypothetical protein CMP76_04470 [Flavobacterium sp.]|uniref:hypothetical protein n=1 Tax=unclassified Flavobacterium TaxID=196869 RepID=UPI000C5E0A73|nr:MULTISPECIES: hypothetical protein [unclassified Flavobacterium]MBF02533.1 hypothetical protein [Flavobacterium sp.]MCO6163528.1 hypothetical protein [Flavobacterium sp. NRK F7]
MKQLFLICLLVASTLTFSQKKKATSKKTPTKTVLAKVDNLTAEIITVNKKKQLVLFVVNEGVQDTLRLKIIENTNYTPLNFKITPFSTSNVKLYHIHWEEKNAISTKLKKEDQDIVESQIWNVAKKELLIGNVQKSSHIVETVFLDKNKTASETQERNRKEGFEFILLPNGDLILKNKTQQNTYAYNVASDKYEMKKGSVSKTTSSRKKR